VAFHDAEQTWVVEPESVIDPTRDHSMQTDASLRDFLKRPVKIDSFLISRNTAVSRFIDPWSLLIESPTVRKKLDNFYLFRAKLCLKITINGSGFYYGHFIAHYIPRSTEDDFSRFTNDPLDTMRKTVYPHVWLNPTFSKGGEMKLPFFCPSTWLTLPEKNYNEMGVLYFSDLVQLKHANDLAPNPIRVTTFAWFEDVDVSTPTRRVVDSTSYQSGVGAAITSVMAANQSSRDEYGEGIVSHISSTAANIAGSLSRAPIIGPFARATERVAGGVGRFARFLGFSRPRQINEIIYTQNFDGGHLAATDQGDTSKSLALTSKQGLTIDPRTAGLGGIDEMSLAYIAGKEAVLTTFSINPSTAVSGDLLFTSMVTPMLFQSDADDIQLTPMAHASLPFRYWTGTIIFRFMVTGSAYHRGRLRLVWDPLDVPTVEPAENTIYSRVIDVEQERDFEMAISWGQFRSFGKVAGPDRIDVSVGNPNGFNTGNIVFDRSTCNGCLGLFLTNEIAVPNTAADSELFITVTARAGDDFKVASPTSYQVDVLHQPIYQLGEGSPVSDSGTPEATTESEHTSHGEPGSGMQIAPIGAQHEYGNIFDVHFGEHGAANVRGILKRYNYHSVEDLGQNAAISAIASVIVRNIFPLTRGSRPDAIHGAGTNFVPFNLVAWYALGYTSWRGSLRWKYAASDLPTNQTHLLSVRRGKPTSADGTGTIAADVSGSLAQMNDAASVYGNASDGALIRSTVGEGTLEAEFPYYSNYRFSSCRKFNASTSVKELDKGFAETWVYTVLGDTTGTTRLYTFVSTGEDFSFLYYVSPPRLSRASLPIPPI